MEKFKEERDMGSQKSQKNKLKRENRLKRLVFLIQEIG